MLIFFRLRLSSADLRILSFKGRLFSLSMVPFSAEVYHFHRAVGFLRGTSAVVVIMLKWHRISYYSEELGQCDPLALVDNFTPVEDNIGLLETRFDEEAVFVFVFPKDVMGSVNLTLLSLFFRVTTTNLSLELLMLGQLVPECA
ncbi:hypothetical protein Tco_0764089 [Tanacetum coccineum]